MLLSLGEIIEVKRVQLKKADLPISVSLGEYSS
jgi:hypothetical protein